MDPMGFNKAPEICDIPTFVQGRWVKDVSKRPMIFETMQAW